MHASDVDDRFRVEVEDRRMGVRFLLYATTGREAIRAFHHPFAAAATPTARRGRLEGGREVWHTGRVTAV